MPNILILHLLSYGITSSIDGNMNAQKLSNRSRLVSYFDYVCAKEQTSSLNNHLNLKDSKQKCLQTRLPHKFYLSKISFI